LLILLAAGEIWAFGVGRHELQNAEYFHRFPSASPSFVELSGRPATFAWQAQVHTG
jgi:hypothetical protein